VTRNAEVLLCTAVILSGSGCRSPSLTSADSHQDGGSISVTPPAEGARRGDSVIASPRLYVVEGGRSRDVPYSKGVICGRSAAWRASMTRCIEAVSRVYSIIEQETSCSADADCHVYKGWPPYGACCTIVTSRGHEAVADAGLLTELGLGCGRVNSHCDPCPSSQCIAGRCSMVGAPGIDVSDGDCRLKSDAD
jgi:hypothetical protein